MKYVQFSDAARFENNSTCTVYEYGGDDDISGAIAEINGRYPESGWAVNGEVKEMVFVLEGTGKVVTKMMKKYLSKDTMVLLDKNEPYYFEGSLRIFIPTVPAWTVGQYKIIA